MSLTQKNTSASYGSNVHPLNPIPVRVQPPADWKLKGEFGYMAFEAGEAGRLVRLAEILRWLESSREIPRSNALELLCDGMPAQVMGWLYWLNETEFATPVPTTSTFGFLTAEQIADRKIKDRQNAIQAGLERERQFGRFGSRPTMQGGLISLGYPEPTEPGSPALLKYLRNWWVLSKRRGATCDVLDDPKIRYATTLAIRLDKAHGLWGYGHTVNCVMVDDTVPIEPPPSWAVQSPVGMLRRGPLPADRLVRLADVVRWFIKERETPRLSAVKRVCDTINANSIEWLYHVKEGAYASPSDPTNGFAKFLPGTGTNAEKLANSFIRQIEALWGNAHEPDTVLEANEHPCVALACTISRAYALWGYGGVAAASVPATATPATPKDWTGEQLAAQRAVLVSEGRRDPVKRLADETGLKDREIRRRIAEYEMPTTAAKKAGMYDQLVNKKGGNKR
jgi:hypothetical protein